MMKKTKSLLWVSIVAALAAAATLHLPAPPAPPSLELTHEEFQWLEAHANQIRIAPLPDSPPIDFIGETGQPDGLTTDYIRLIEQQLGVRFVQIKCDSWREILKELHTNEIDLMGSIQNTPDRRKFLRFTKPYLSLPNVILTRKDRSDTLDIDSIKNLKIAVVDQSATHGWLMNVRPEYTLLPVTDAASGFRMLSFNEADAMVTDLGVASYYIEEMGISNLRVAGGIDYPWELCLASRSDWPLLNSILNKALAQISNDQRRAIQQKWITLSDTVHISRRRYLKVIGSILFIMLTAIGLIIFRNRTLHQQVNQNSRELGEERQSHALASHALDESKHRFQVLAETSNDLIWETDANGTYTYVSPRGYEIFGFTPEELIHQSSFSLMIPTDAARTIDFLRTSTPKTTVDYETSTFIHKDGHHVILESSSMAFSDMHGDLAGFRGVSRNITARIKAERDLRQSEERFRNLVETTSDWIWEVDNHGNYTYSSPQSIPLIGHTPSELQGRHFTEFMHPEEAETIRILFAETVEIGNSIQSLINSYTHKDGRIITIEISAVPFYDSEWNILGYHGISRDITNRVMIEKSIRNIVEGVVAVGHRFFDSMASQLSKTLNADFTFIAETIDKGGTIMHTISVSDKGNPSPNFGFETGKTPCQTVIDSNHCIHLENAREKYPQAELLQTLEIESYIGIPLLDSKKKVMGVLVAMYRAPVEQVEFACSIMQVFAGRTAAELERLHATKELISLRNLLENIINSMPSILIGIDTDGRVMQWNLEAEKATGITGKQAQGQPLHQVFPDVGSELNQIIKTLDNHTRQHHEHLHCALSGKPCIVNVTVYPITADGSEGAVIRVDDVTEQVHIEEMMMQSEKMMSIGGLAAGMAHEINNPLAGILQSLQVINNRVTQETERNITAAKEAGTSMESIRNYMESRDLLKMMDSITDAGHRAARIVDNMLSFSRKAESKFEPNDLAEILDRSIELASNDYDLKKRFDFRHIRIERDYSPLLKPIHCEGSQIQQVILNLLSNSAQAMATHTENSSKDQIMVKLSRDKNMALIEIEDNGPGMSTEIRKRAFEPFFTTKEVGQGTGLGLSVSYFIITENHGGSMDVTSALGKGTRFSIRIPIAS